jgi:hypothetical protein
MPTMFHFFQDRLRRLEMPKGFPPTSCFARTPE